MFKSDVPFKRVRLALARIVGPILRRFGTYHEDPPHGTQTWGPLNSEWHDAYDFGVLRIGRIELFNNYWN